ncbi:DUF4817 domain-containing protein [Caerostris extrusa]|uniref:DUF4817 domain-containing protein n=1 Tax=Caerostris extrusa TaxID=172846 RepID=A0AAV4Q1I7_CAEEX|nr:DUF4817 domain-containing protein [Caerostris extrusa]
MRGTQRFPHIAFKELVIILSMKDRTLLVKLYYKKGDCVAVTLKKFQTIKGMKKGCCPMSANGLEKMYKKFEDVGAFDVKYGSGRKPIASIAVENVATPLQEDTSCGMETCSAPGIADL